MTQIKFFALFIYLITSYQVCADYGQMRRKAPHEYSYQVPHNLIPIKSQDEFTLKECEQFNGDENEDYFLICNKNKLMPAPSSINKLSSTIHKVNNKSLQNYFLNEMKNKTISKLNDAEVAIDKIIKCFENPSYSDKCEDLIQKNINTEKIFYPKMKQELALSTRIPFRGTVVRVEEKYHSYVNNFPKHLYSDTKIDRLSITEYDQALKLIKKEGQEVVKHFRDKKLLDNDACFIKDKNGHTDYKNRGCRIINRPKEARLLRSTMSKNTKVHKGNYHSILQKVPFLMHILPESKQPDRKIAIKNAYKILKDQIHSEKEKIKTFTKNQRLQLLDNQEMIESFLKRHPDSLRPMCDIAQSSLGNRSTQKFSRTFLIIGATILSGSLCFLSAGIACPVGMAIAHEAFFITDANKKYQDTILKFQTGQANIEDVQDALSSRNTSVILSPLSFVGVGVVRHVRNVKAVRSIRPLNSIDTKDKLLINYLDYSPTSVKQNVAWIKDASRNKGYFVDVENGALKRLNDTLADKDTVTALTNLHKNLLFKSIDQLKLKYPNVNLSSYSDFKSTRFSFKFPENFKKNKQFSKDLNRAFDVTNKAFEQSVSKIKGLKIPSSEKVSTWFNCGAGVLADSAGLLSRLSRSISRPSSKCITLDNKAAEKIKQKLTDVEAARTESLDILTQNAPQLVGNRATLSKSLIEVLRKNKEMEPTDLSKLINSRFGVELSSSQVEVIKGYSTKADEFSPGIWVDKRELASLEGASNGALSADFKGMGAFNEESVQHALKNAAGNINQALKNLRNEEKIVTKGFNIKKETFVRTVSDTLKKHNIITKTVCSGDDCVSIFTSPLTHAVKKDLVSGLTKDQVPSSYRLVFVPDNVASADRTMLGVHGELFEKQLRKEVTGIGGLKISEKTMDKMVFAFDMPKTLSKGKVDLMIGTKDLQLTSAQNKLLQEGVQKAILRVNKEFKSNYGASQKFEVIKE